MPAAAPPGIGPKLQRARIERDLSIEETAWRTRIRPDLLRALELEQFEQIGHLAHVRSHLSSYARFLGIDPSAVVQEFEATHETPSPIQELDRQVQESEKPPRARWRIAGGISALILVGAALLGALGGQAERPTGEAAPLPVLQREPSPIVPAVSLQVEATADTEVSVVADGEQIFEGLLPAGTARTFLAQRWVDLVGADAARLRLTHNGRVVEAAGAPGEVLRARFGPKGPTRP